MKKNIIIGILITIIIILLIVLINLLNIQDQKTPKYNEVIKKDDQYVIIKENNTTKKIDNVDLNVGDIIKEEKETTKVIKNTTTTKKIIKEEDVLNEIETYYMEIANNEDISFKETAKNYFIKVVDFIFYNEPINGIYFKELKNKTKITILKTVLLMDNKIENIFPNYKEELNEKYQNIKENIIFEYMNSLTYISSKNQEECEKLKSEFNDIKKNISITWSNIKDAFLNNKEKAKNSIEEWYKIFKNS